MAHNTASPQGILYIVATPIGNQADISDRARHILKTVDCIAAEDTRHTRPFLSAMGITNRMLAFHAHNEAKVSATLLEKLKAGEHIALVSDAGTPLIRDPGYPLVKQARDAGIAVSPIPGACALIAALSASGLPADTFTFAGFLPAKQSERRRALQTHQATPHTLIFYESTHRLRACLLDIAEVLGEETDMVLAKELTKTYETFQKGNVRTILDWLDADQARLKGEFVLMLAPREVEASTSIDAETCLALLTQELPVKKAAAITAKLTGKSKNELYQQALQAKQ